MSKYHTHSYSSAEETSSALSQQVNGILPPTGTKSHSQTLRCCGLERHTKLETQTGCLNNTYSA